MKTKMTLLIIFSAIVTLSFSFVAVKKEEAKEIQTVSKTAENEPIGGLVSEESL